VAVVIGTSPPRLRRRKAVAIPHRSGHAAGVLLFHGTGGPRAIVEAIAADGLLPHGGREWAARLSGVAEHVFACTTPIGSRDGDPIRFAQRGVWKQHRAWLVVIELPDAAARELIVGAVRNDELARYWVLEAFAGATVQDDVRATRAVLARMRERGVRASELLRPAVRKVADGLCDRPPDAETLIQFEAAYLRARPAHKARVAASYGLTIPAWFADDPHYPACAGCLWNLFEVVYEVPDVLDERERPIQFRRGTWTRIDLPTFGAHLDALGRWLGDIDPERLDRLISRRGQIAFAALQAAFPPPATAVPRTFLPDLVTGDLAARVREPDTQVMLARVPPEHIVGALDLGGANKLSALVRPDRGETLSDRLRHRVAELRDERARTGRAVIRD
jgi:hypothetical protein